ncbi:MAG: selenium cofactor biosynthesis protein YqeC, partial [Pseudomonadota bacterium]
SSTGVPVPCHSAIKGARCTALERLGQGLALLPVPAESLLDVDRPLDLARAAAPLQAQQPRPGLRGLAASLSLDPTRPGLWSIVGSGGKTSLLYTLAAELAARGHCLAVTTTTHIHPPAAGQADGPWLWGQESPGLEQVAARLLPGRPLCLAAGRRADGKLQGLSPGQMATLLEVPGLWVLCEADGAAGRPLKGWAAHEPALTGLEAGVIVVAGASGLGRPLEARWVHRPQEFARASGLAPGQAVTPLALALALGGAHGPLRGQPDPPAAPPASLLINQAESLSPAAWRQLCAALSEHGRWRALLGASLRLGRYAACPPGTQALGGK